MSKKRKKEAIPARNWSALGVIIFLALAVRLIFLIFGSDDPFRNYLFLDSKVYHLLAEEIATSNFWGDQVFFRAPLFQYLLGFSYIIFGISSTAIRILHFILGLGSVYLIYEIARLRFTNGIAISAGIVTALYPTLYFFEAELLPTTITVFTYMLSLYLLTLYEKKPKINLLFYSGLALGAAILARPVILVFVLMLILWLRIILGGKDWKIIFSRYALIIAGAALVILPVTIRNYIVESDIVLVSSQGGANLFIGNNNIADGLTVKFPDAPGQLNKYEDHIWSNSVALAEHNTKKEMTAAEVSSYWSGLALGYISNKSNESIRLFFKKIYYFLCGEELFNNRNPLFTRDFASLYSIFIWDKGVDFPYGILSPLAILGGLFLLRSKNKQWLLHIFSLSMILTTSLFFINSRFRQPLIPIMIIFAVFAIYHIYQLLSKEKWLLSGAYFSLFVIGMIVLNPSGKIGSAENLSLSHFYYAQALYQDGKTDKVLEELQKALTASNQNGKAWLGLGSTYYDQGEIEQAINTLQSGEKVLPRNSGITVKLAEIYFEQDDYRNALIYYNKTFKLGFQTEIYLLNAAESSIKLEMPENARNLLKTILETYPNNLKAQEMLNSLNNK